MRGAHVGIAGVSRRLGAPLVRENEYHIGPAVFRTGKGVADYAAQLQITPTHLSRVCRDASGRPALALLNERIMHEARRLLLETDLPAREVAEQLGFSSAAYFTRAFSQATGRTPSAFRKPALRA